VFTFFLQQHCFSLKHPHFDALTAFVAVLMAAVQLAGAVVLGA
jgi:hypothetical protein